MAPGDRTITEEKASTILALCVGASLDNKTPDDSKALEDLVSEIKRTFLDCGLNFINHMKWKEAEEAFEDRKKSLKAREIFGEIQAAVRKANPGDRATGKEYLVAIDKVHKDVGQIAGRKRKLDEIEGSVTAGGRVT